MNAKLFLKLIAAGGAIVAASVLLRGHDILTAIILSLALLLVLTKVIFAVVLHRKRGHRGFGGTAPPLAPALVPAPRPPSAPPAVFYQPFE
jgi:hypothetical protein